MRVRQGWSGEYKPNRWGKFSVELDEEDLRRILMEHQPADLVEQTSKTIPVLLAYRLLEIEAERLVVRKLCTRYEFDADEGAQEIGRLNEEFLLTLVRAGVHA